MCHHSVDDDLRVPKYSGLPDVQHFQQLEPLEKSQSLSANARSNAQTPGKIVYPYAIWVQYDASYASSSRIGLCSAIKKESIYVVLYSNPGILLLKLLFANLWGG